MKSEKSRDFSPQFSPEEAVIQCFSPGTLKPLFTGKTQGLV